MRVEVDLFNGSRAEYQKFLAHYYACRYAPLMAADPLAALTAAVAGRDAWGPRLKSDADPLPFPPRVEVSSLGDAAVLTGALAVGLSSALENAFADRG